MVTEWRRVLATGKDDDGDITSLCNSVKTWSPRSRALAISDIEGGVIGYFVQDSLKNQAIVRVKSRNSIKYLATDPDSSTANG